MTFYITTPIYYVNDVPHLGHAYTTIVADALARFHRMRGEPTRFLTGTDEHGQKVEEAARKRGLSNQAFVDEVAPRFQEAWTKLDITNDDFIRTTDARHKAFVTDLWQRLHAAGTLSLNTYQGWYCVGCEAFYTESQLEKADDGAWRCPTHKRAVDWVDKERSWFFNLERFAQPLLDHIAANPGFIQPEAYRNEVVSFLRGGLRDLSVSRTSFGWGVPVPTPDPEGQQHVMYVWLDALSNYMSALGDEGSPLRQQFWPAVHLLGKDILRFHAVYWPAFLLAAGLPLPQTILCHGWWTVRGEKISKSLPATRIAPLALAGALAEGNPHGFDLGNDAMRYYLLREVPLGNDGDFTFESLFARYNAELANDLGNLVNRTLAMLAKLGGEHPPASHDRFDGDGAHAQLLAATTKAVDDAGAAFTAFAPSRALEAIWTLVREANKYIDATQPWRLARTGADANQVAHVLFRLRDAILVIGHLASPVLPHATRQMRAWFGDASEPRWPGSTEVELGATLAAGTWAAPADARPLFPRLDDDRQAAIVAAIAGDAAVTSTPAGAPTAIAAAAPEAPAAGPTIAFADFARAELRVGRVTSAAVVPKAKKLLHLTVDLGEAAPRSIVAGIAEAYTTDALVGRQVIVVANLEPATIRGIRSEGMILAAGDDAIVGLSALDRDVAPGTRVR
ncbi:MAG: methionine--tRNA ligase [Kofleriaceae bacterium]